MLVTLVFFTIVLVWVALPFVPGLREIREHRDVEPLRVVHDFEVDVQHFARGFRRYLDRALAEPWARGRRAGGRMEGSLPDGTAYHVFGRTASGPVDVTGLAVDPCEAVLVACGALRLPDQAEFLLEVFAEGDLAGGTHSLYRAVLADGDLSFGVDSQVLRWAHAQGSVSAASGCEFYGRLSAGQAIHLAAGCRFDRLHAPRLEFGVPLETLPPRVATTRFEASDLIGVTDVAAGRWRIRGDLTLPEGTAVEADLVVLGRAHLGDGAKLIGSIKTRGDLTLGRGVEVEGSLVSEREVWIGEGCGIHGPVLSERSVTIGAGTRVGSATRPTTVSAATITAVCGAVVHGTVWAHRGGRVVDRERSSDSLPRREPKGSAS